MEEMFITTSGRADESVKLRAKTLAGEFHIPYIERKKRSIANYMDHHQADCLVLGKERDELHRRGEQPFFFHPNSASFRIKRVLRGESDPFIEAAGLKKGMTILDCTLGLASDSIIASAVVGRTGSVTGIEANPYVAHILKRGLKEWVSPLPELNDAMKRVKVINGLSQSLLKELPDDSFDVVYFDPMFEEGLTDSHGINPIRSWAHYERLTGETIEEAKRVAKERVLLKEHFRSTLFGEHDFKVLIRPSSKFHYGTIDL